MVGSTQANVIPCSGKRSLVLYQWHISYLPLPLHERSDAARAGTEGQCGGRLG